MITFLWNLALAAVWALAVGELTLGNLLIGFALGYVVLWLVRGLLGTQDYCARILWIIEFMLYFLWELVKANLRVAFDVVTPRHYMRPGILALPLDAESDMEITLLANTISLTPGTLSLNVSDDRKVLYIHHMYISDPKQQKQALKHGFERRLLRILR